MDKQISQIIQGRLNDSKKLLVIVDGSGIFNGQKLLDYEALLSHIRGARTLQRASYYAVEEPGKNIKKFAFMLNQSGFDVQTKTTRDYTAWNVSIVLDVIESLPMFDVLAIVTGLTTFSDLFARVRARGKEVEVWSFEEKLSLFRDTASYCYSVDPFIRGDDPMIETRGV